MITPAVNTPSSQQQTNDQYVTEHLPRFTASRSRYEQYQRFIKEVLQEASRRYAPLAIVDARTKTIPSFVDKILRKREKYANDKSSLPKDPLLRMTDLCGGRIIVQNAQQVKNVCRLIERAFDLDDENSQDDSQRHKPAEFGYRSVHYIVMVNLEKLKKAGITLEPPPDVLLSEPPLKAEIQVRTILAHAWADLVHDNVYKAELSLPDYIRRQVSAQSAILENADNEFGHLVQTMLDYKSNLGAYHKRQDVEKEIQVRRIVLAAEPDNLDLAARTALLCLSIGDHFTALLTLRPYETEPHQGIQRALGITLTELHWDQPKSQEYLEGRSLLEKACAHEDKDAETLCALAESWVRDNDLASARAFFKEAMDIDSTEPVTLCRYLEFEVTRNGNQTAFRVATPMIQSAISRCYRQIEARVNVPRAWASLTLMHLYLNEPFKALDALASVIRLCEGNPNQDKATDDNCQATNRPCAAGCALLRTWDAINRLSVVKEKLDGYEWVRRGTLLGLAVKVQDKDALNTLHKLASWKDKPKPPHLTADDRVVILSGACLPAFQPIIDGLKPHLHRACNELSFILFSGGSQVGVSGLSGDLAEASEGRIRAYGYMPRLLPRGVMEDTRYADQFSSPGDDFTPLDPFQGWTDIIAAGLSPAKVKLLSYCGGLISGAEYKMALALGARVGMVINNSLPKDRRMIDPFWTDHPNLLPLPLDAMTLRAFLLVDEIPCKKPEFELAAKMAHEDFVKAATPKEPSLAAWDELAEDLKISNFHQIAYAENILKTVGLGIRKISDSDQPPFKMKDLKEEAIERLAEMEHGRWIVERLMRGWRLGEKNIPKKLSPYLVPWDDNQNLPADVRKKDIEPTLNLPRRLQEAGLEIYLLADESDHVAPLEPTG
jgi:ppGpp synthetase/RelA/SpoT-type nucleotidyltranferase